MKNIMLGGILIAFSMMSISSAKTQTLDTLIVDAKSNIFGGGKSVPPEPGGGGGGLLPPEISFDLATVESIIFPMISGEISCCGGGSTFNGPDGGSFASGTTNISSFQGISGIVHGGKTMFLVGVFLDDSEPVDPAPERLDFSNADTLSDLAPAINQTFFIGDGLTETGQGERQSFAVPEGATRLYLGFADGLEFSGQPGYYSDNVGELTVVIESILVTSVESVPNGMSNTFTLNQNYPNPFNPSTTIEYELKKSTQMSLKIHNTLGQQVKALVNEWQSMGSHRVQWDGKDDNGLQLPSGLYFVRLKVRDAVQTHKMILLR